MKVTSEHIPQGDAKPLRVEKYFLSKGEMLVLFLQHIQNILPERYLEAEMHFNGFADENKPHIEMEDVGLTLTLTRID